MQNLVVPFHRHDDAAFFVQLLQLSLTPEHTRMTLFIRFAGGKTPLHYAISPLAVGLREFASMRVLKAKCIGGNASAGC